MQRARWRGWRWIRRSALGLGSVIALAVLAVVIGLHTEAGRELVRGLVEQQLQSTFVGGASLGAIEGTPLSQLVLHDLVIRGPDRRPAISVSKLTVEIGILPLISHEARVGEVIAEGVDVALERDANGELAITHLTRPGPSSGWSVGLPKIAIRRAHVALDTGTERINLDHLTIDAHAELPHGGPVDAGIDLRGTWRERGDVALAVQAAVHNDDRGLSVPSLSVHAGEVSVTASKVTVVAQAHGRAPAIGGTVSLNAPAAAVARLVPRVVLPADVALTVTATPVVEQPWTDLAVTGRIGQADVRFTGAADLTDRHARGELTTGALDVTALSSGVLAGTASARVVFDIQPGPAGALPTATATIRGWATVADLPTATFDIAVNAAGDQASATLDATGDGVHAHLVAKVRAAGDQLAIESAELRATTSDPVKATGGKAPVHGALEAHLTASGALRPTPSLAVAGTIDGRQLRMKDLSVGSLHLAVDAKRLPNRPYGTGHVELAEIVRGDAQLGALKLDATDRPDGKIAVTLRSRPVENPWLIDLDALVTPPVVDSGSIAIDVVRHRVRAGTGADWVGRTGHIEIGPEQIAVRDLASASPQGRIALAGSYERAGRRAGDLAANLDIKGLALDNLGKVYHGTLDSHIAVARRGRAWSGDIAVDATGVAVDASPPPGTTARASQRATGTPLGASVASSVGSGATPIAASLAGALAPAVAASAVHAAPPPAAQRMLVDAHVHGKLGDRKLAMTIEAASRGVGSAQVAVELDTPVVITDGKAWQRLGRSAIRTGRVQLHGIELARLAQLAELEGPYGGRIDGDIQLSQTTVGGKIAASKVTVPRLRGMTGVDVMLDLSQPSPSELAPRLTAAIAGVGQVTAEATLGTPDRLLDPAAWAALGPRALHTASLHATDVAIDPAMLDRFGVVSDLRGKLSVAVDVGEAGQSVKATVAVTGLRGDPIVEPIDVKITAATGDRETTAAVAIAARGATLLDLETKIPGSAIELVRQLQTDPAAAKSTRLAASAKLASVDAPKLLAMLGSTEIVAGKLDGDIELGGTFGVPTATARLTATGLETRPNTRYKGKSVEKLALTASWDGHAAKLALDGSETEGGLLKLSATVDPKALADGSVTVVATKLDLAPLLAFVPGPGGGASGLLDANLTLKGLDVRTTQLTGEAHLTEARVPIAPTVGTLRQAKIDAVIANRELKLKIDGRLGGGTLSVDGSVALAGASPNSGKAKLTLRKVSPIGAVEPTISADVTAELAHEANQWRATLVVDHGFIVVPHDRGEKLKPAGMPTDMAFANGSRGGNRKPKTQAAPVNPIFLVKVTLHSTSVESDEFRGNIKGQLDVSANGDAFGITGGIDADRGDLDLFGRRYYVERAGVHFDGSLDPLLDVRISHDFTDVTTVTEVRGRVSKPELTLTSDPGSYSQSELLGFLLGGDPGGDAPGAGSDRVADAGASLVANKLGGYIRDALPIDIDVLRYEAATAATSAAVTVGTWIGHSLFLAYRQHLEARQDENLGEGEVEYWLSRRVMLEGTAGDRGYNGLDLLWRKRY